MAAFEDLALFVGIVDAGSLSAAARAAGIPKSSVSRRLSALEARLNARLVQRSTRKLGLTETGRTFYDRCKPLIEEARAAENELLAQPGEPHGLLRITTTGAFGRLYVAPLLGEFLSLFPRVDAQLLLLDRPVDLIEEGFDLAIRMGPLEDSGMIARKLGDIERVLCASPEYLKREGPVDTVADLKTRQGLLTVEGNRWRFRDDDRILSITSRSRLATNQIEVLYEAVLLGCGVAMLPRFLVLDDIATGRLVRLLPETPPIPGAAHAIWPSRSNPPARTRSFVDFLAEKLAGTAVWDRPWHRVAHRP